MRPKSEQIQVDCDSSLTLSGNQSDFVRGARSHGEQKLLAAAKCGHRAALDQLFQPLAKKTFQIIYRMTRNREDAEDALQECFLRAFVHIKDFDGRSSFSTWLTRIAINSALMILRKRRTSKEVSSYDSGDPESTARHPEVADRAPNPETHYLQREREKILRGAIRVLRPSIRRVIEIQQLQERSVEEAAQMMGITTGAAKARLFHARVALGKVSALKAIAETTLKYGRR